MEIVPKEMLSIDLTQKIETPDYSYNFISEAESDICFEEMLVEGIRQERKIQHHELSENISFDDQDENKSSVKINQDPYQNSLCTNKELYIIKILEINEREFNDSINREALSFILIVGLVENSDTVFKILEDLEIQKNLKATLELPQVTTDLSFDKISDAAFRKRKQLIGMSIDYSLKSLKPFCLKYTKEFMQTAFITPRIKVDSIRFFLK